MRETIAIAIDLGGTRSRVAALGPHATFVARTEHLTAAESGPDAIIDQLAAAVREIREGLPGVQPIGLGIAAPGPVDRATGVVIQAPNLGWRNVPLASRLEAATGLPTVLGNDANLAALGEARFGAGRGEQNLVYLTVSTGIGSGILVNGSLLLGETGAAGEAGHTTVWWDGRLCSCGNRGCLEAYASGTAIVERALEAMDSGRSSALARYGRHFEAEEVEQAAQAGDALARELIADAGTALGVGIRNLLHVFDPAVVVIGGGVSRMGALLWDPMREVVHADPLGTYAQRVRIVPAELGDDPGLVGAATLVFETLGSRDGV